MKPKLEDIRFVNQCARNQFKRELGRTLSRPDPQKKRGRQEKNTLWNIRFKEVND
ncbi:hypothetical protein [Rhodoferax mekongensis]|uniref:Uncharacterized protein n=1 Tax=Rhodoferax mekongensis TaxID=3068341 RepID=A0ABZ0B2A8_9BURK|nr:hypothetical protein [Rhodoferax sp. TBRC 17307]WNO05992.1 hypothetical protein RAN89_06070 [Rhodoferax sp. TBRC 17307]